MISQAKIQNCYGNLSAKMAPKFKNVKNKDIRTLKDTSENHNTPKAHYSRRILSRDFVEQF